MRRRAVYRDPGGQVRAAARLLHGVLAWLPARLMAAAFALAGSFEGAVAGWRAPRAETPPATSAFFERTEDLIDRVGHGARGAAQAPASAEAGTGLRRPARPWPWSGARCGSSGTRRLRC